MSKQDLSARRSNLSETKRALLEKLLQGKAASAAKAPSIPQRRERDRAPLSFSQQRLWFLDQIAPGNPFYIIPAVVRMTGSLDVAALERSLNEIVARHEVLRTSFVTVDGRPVQVIAPSLTLAIPVVNLEGADDGEAEALRLAAQEAQQPFDLGQGALLRAKLLRLTEDEHILLLMMHHIISDEWSIGVLLREMGILYEAFITGKNAALPDLPVQYGDFAIWQQKWIEEENFQKQLSYWKQQLEGIPAVLDMPTDRARPPVPNFRGGKQWLSLSSGFTKALNRFSEEQGATLFMTLLGAFATLLYRYTGRQDIVIGSPIANRNHSEVEGLIGCFINTLALRTDLSGDPTFADLLGRVKKIALGAYANQDLPFEKIVEELQPERDLSRNPLFNVMLVFQNVPMPALELPGLILKPMEVHNDTAKLDLALSISETATGLVGYFEYSKDLFDDATISRLISHFQILLEACVANPHHPISALPLLPESEHQTLIDWNNTVADFPRDKCIHHLFEAQVERTPHAIALVYEQQQLTYQELNRRANQLARHLRSMEVGPEIFVALCVERSVETVVGILGILKAGGAYVPLDPAYPKARLSFMLEDSQAPVMLTQKRLLEKLPEHKAATVCLDADWKEIARENDENLAGGATADNLAYVIFTSGSTGRPKGVLIEHRGMCNMDRAQAQSIALDSKSRVLQFASLSFDASIFEIIMALLKGAALCLARHESSLGGTPLIEQIREQSISVILLPPSTLATLPREPMPALRTIIVAGEPCTRELVAGWNSGKEFFNAYGPTETTVWASVAQCVDGTAKPTIGKPIANTQIYLTGNNLMLAPIGVSGELCIGGDGLARGYLNRADLTAEKFMPNPFNRRPGTRLYRTGDSARYTPAGDLDFIGRIDHQVKVRGFRIEPGEIETVLAAHAAVREAIVMAREDASGDKRLIGYLVRKNGEPITASEIRIYLKEKLPDYMIPSVLMMMDQMPVTANGKIDRRALPLPDSTRPELSQAFVPPGDRKEKLLADIWTEILGLKQVGIHDNFFELGGDSILSIQVIARANRAGLRLTPRQMFQHQTINELAAAATTTEAIEAEQGVVSGEVKLTAIQRWFFEQDLADPHHFNQSVLLEARQSVDAVALRKALEQLINHHDALRLRFERQAESWRQTNSETGTHNVLTQFDLSHLAEAEQRPAINTAASDLQSSLDLVEGPLVRAALFDLGSDKPDNLLIVIHHLAVDAVSWRILLEDLQTAYYRISGGDAVGLPPKTTSFKQWAEMLNQYAQSEELKQEFDYWQNLLDIQARPMPVDYPGRDNTVASSDMVTVELNQHQTRALLQEVPEAYHTQINEALLSALSRGYSLWSGEQELIVDVEGHGREEVVEGVDLTRTVGWFTTIYPVVLESREEETAAESLKRVKEEVRGIPERGIGYGLLRYVTEDEHIKRRLKRLPQAEISFNYLGQLDQSIAESTLFNLGRHPDSPSRSPRGRRDHLIEIDCWIAQGKLNIQIAFSRNLHRRASIERLAGCLTDALGGLVAQHRAQASALYAASDFPLSGLDQEGLDKIASGYSLIEDIYPLSPMQKGMLFHSLYEPESGIYVTQMSCELTGELDVEALCRAWQQVIDRHTILRTAVEWEQVEEPLQIVVRRADLNIEQQDWRGVDEDEQRQKLERHLHEGRRRGFDFRQPPLMRVGLMRVADDKYYFVWEHHHLLLDGWSTAALINEMFTCYESRKQGKPVKLDKRRPYRDYIQWVMKQDHSKAQQYWQQEFSEVKSATKLGVEMSGGRHSQDGYTQQALRLSEQQSEKLNMFARQQQITLNTIVQGCWAVLMSRYSGQPQVVYGVTVSGRGMALEGVEQMIGLMINTLPVRVEVSGDQQVGKWLRAIQQKQVEQREYEYSSLSQVQGWSGIEAGERLFESIVVFENYPVEASLNSQLEGAMLTASNVRSVEETNYGLTVAVLPGREMSIEIGYERQRYDEAAIRRILGHMEVLLDAISSQPSSPLSRLPLMSHLERRQLLLGFNNTSRPFPSHQCVHQLIEQRVSQSPDAVAVVSDDHFFSYSEINARANQLAHFLTGLSDRDEQIVAICLDSSVELVVAMLGMAKAGAAYLPLDPQNPPHRLAFMIDDSQANIVITKQGYLGLLPQQITVICLDRDEQQISRQRIDNPHNTASSSNAVYVVYTSGSTGQPKGILVEHRSLVNECLAFIAHHELGARDRLLQFASVGFDVAAEEVFAPLMSGAAIVIAEGKTAQGIEELLIGSERQRISVLNLPAAYWHEWVSQMSSGEVRLPEWLRLVIVGNERVSLDRFEVWMREAAGRVEWKNAYGPTEATITTTIYRAEERGRRYESVPIGRPITNAEVYILDQEMNPVPIGVAGEIYIGGAGVARGYVKRAGLTAESFKPHPYSSEPGARLYKTGDVGRYLEEGEIEYKGRKDEQVKVRGYRVELGEVEAAMREHPDVKEAVVVVREDEQRHARLVGYVVADDERLTPALVREYVSERLPVYMRPSAIRMISEIPVTANGKVDRRALPDVEWGAETSRERREAKTTAEREMARVWMEVLGVKEVGVDENFFEMGGDSILSLQVVARARRAGLRVTPKQVFEHPTVEGLARVAEGGEMVEAEQGMVRGEVELTPIQRWWMEQGMEEVDHYNQAVMLEMDESVRVEEVREVVKKLVEHHDALRMRYRRDEAGGWRQWNEGEEMEEVVREIDLTGVSEGMESEAIEEASREIQKSLRLERGPVMRVGVMKVGRGVGKLVLMVVHHLVVDGVSWRVMLEDMERGLEQVRRGEEVRFEAKTTSFKQWAHLLNQYARSGELQKERSYWLNQNVRQVKPFPIDQKAEVNDEMSARVVSVNLDEIETRALLQEVPKVYHTQIDEVLMAGLAETLRSWTQGRTVMVDVEGHGREEIFENVDLTRTVGWFTTIYPVVLEIGETTKTGEVLKRVKQQMRTIPKKGIGYGIFRYLAEDEQFNEELRKLPEAEVSFNYLGQTDQVLNRKACFRPATESAGEVVSPKAKRKYLIDINAQIEGGRLYVYWSYSENIHRRETIDRLAEDYIRALRRIIIHCQSPDAGGYTPADFPLARLNQDELWQLEKTYRQIEDIYPLSPMQEGMLFHSLYSPGSDLYFEQFSCRLQGDLDIAAFKQSWQEVINRHSILRTACVWEERTKPLQIVLRQVALPCDQQDWRGFSPAEQRRQIEHYLEADRSRGFILSKAPLMRVALIQLADDAYYFVWSHHHLLLDGWSTSIVLKEAFNFYDALSRGEKAHFEQPHPYRDYIAWLQRQDVAKAEEFWRQTLKGISSPTPLGVDRSAKAVLPQGEQYREERTQLSKATTAALQSLARRQQLTLSTLIQGAWALLLSRYSGEREVSYGTVVSGRPAELDGAETMVGLFINTLPVRVKITEDEPLVNWLKKQQKQQVELRQYEYSPLAAIQSWSDVARGVPLFESIVVFENYPVDKTLQGGSKRLKIDEISAEETTNYALTLEASPGEEMRLSIGYDCRRFDDITIKRMLGHMEALLDAISSQPSSPLSRLPLMSQAERRQLLLGFNNTSRPFPSHQCVHQLIEQRVSQSPDAVAVISDDHSFSYSEISARANRLAHFLTGLSVRPDQIVAICLDSSVELVIAMLGVTKAGAAYLPLDPQNPSHRLAFMIDDSQANIVITKQGYLGLLPQQITAICLDTDSHLINQYSTDNPHNTASSSNAVYVVYTSGSTGQPKGILVEHRSLVNECLAFITHHELGERDRLLQFASVGFDVAAEEVFAPLMSGAAIVIAEGKTAQGIEELLSGSERQRVSVLNLPAAYWHEWVSQMSSGEVRLPEWLRLVIVGNERVSLDRFEVWMREAAGRVEWKNAYGPTEATITTTIYRAEARGRRYESVPIGRPITNAEVYILDQEMNPVPIGVAGEIYIGGAGVARGYVKRAGVTAESFKPHPYSSEPGARLYKTGDVGRYLEEGEIEYKGRKDEQVKVRGYRVELGEVEAAMREQAGVREAVVVIREDEGSHARLVGYVVAEDERLTASAVREYVSERLPVYMRPSAIKLISEIPVTANGKVDRRALPDVEWGAETSREKREAKTTAEREMARVWMEVLGVKEVGVDENFFEMGGDSILSLQVVARARRAGLRVTPKQVFEHPTVEGLARVAEGGEVVEAEQGMVRGEVELTPIQRWWMEQGMEEEDHYNQAVMLEMDESVRVEEVKEVVKKMVEHHDALRMRYRRDEAGGWRQWNEGEEMEEVVREIDLTGVSEGMESEAIEEASREIQKSLSLERGPVMRVGVMEVGRGRGKLVLMVVHHLVVDGVSWRVMLEDMERGLEQVRRGEEVRFEAKTTSFKQWAHLLNQYAQSEELKQEFDYWQNLLDIQARPMPVDYPGGDNTVASSDMVTVELNQHQTRALLQEVPEAYHTQINEALLSALSRGYSRWSGEQELIVDVEGHGREEVVEGVDLTRTVGWFTTIYPVVLESREEETAAESLKRVKEEVRRIPERGIGYGLLRYVTEDEQIRERLRRLPQAEISFNYLGQTDQVIEEEGWFKLAHESAGEDSSPAGMQKYLMEVNAIVEEGKLRVDWSYSRNLYKRSSIEGFANAFKEALSELIEHCQSGESGGHTPSDFPHSGLNQKELDDFISEIAEFAD